MSDDPIRDLLAKIARPTMDLRPGWVAAPFGHVIAEGGDIQAVRTWVKAHEGYVDDPDVTTAEPTGLHAGQSFGPIAMTTDRRRFILPAAALGM